MEAIDYSGMQSSADSVPMPQPADPEPVADPYARDESDLYAAGNSVEAPARQKRPRTKAQMEAFEKARNIRYQRCAEARARREAELKKSEQQPQKVEPEAVPKPSAQAPAVDPEKPVTTEPQQGRPKSAKRKDRAKRRQREELEWMQEKQRVQELLAPLLHSSRKKKRRARPAEVQQPPARVPPPASLQEPVRTVQLSASDIMRHYGF